MEGLLLDKGSVNYLTSNLPIFRYFIPKGKQVLLHHQIIRKFTMKKKRQVTWTRYVTALSFLLCWIMTFPLSAQHQEKASIHGKIHHGGVFQFPDLILQRIDCHNQPSSVFFMIIAHHRAKTQPFVSILSIADCAICGHTNVEGSEENAG
jgi:hypothetical protein